MRARIDCNVTVFPVDIPVRFCSCLAQSIEFVSPLFYRLASLSCSASAHVLSIAPVNVVVVAPKQSIQERLLTHRRSQESSAGTLHCGKLFSGPVSQSVCSASFCDVNNAICQWGKAHSALPLPKEWHCDKWQVSWPALSTQHKHSTLCPSDINVTWNSTDCQWTSPFATSTKSATAISPTGFPVYSFVFLCVKYALYPCKRPPISVISNQSFLSFTVVIAQNVVRNSLAYLQGTSNCGWKLFYMLYILTVL